jgi:transcriptional regulator with XRE-family HTH domain
MEHVDPENLKAQLREQRGNFQSIAERAGMSYSWLSKFANDHIPNPGITSLRKLKAALDAA